MADEVRKVGYRYVTIPNRPGEGARVLGALRDAGVDLLAVHAFPRGDGAQLDLVAADPAELERTAADAGLELSATKDALLVRGEDRPGAAAALLEALGGAGINVTAMDAVAAGAGRYGALIWVDQGDVDRASQALG